MTAFLSHEAEHPESGDGAHDHDDSGEIDDPVPEWSAVTAFVEIVPFSDPAKLDDGGFVVAGLAVDEEVGRVAGPFQSQVAFGVVDAKVGDFAAEVVGFAEMFGDGEFIEGGAKFFRERAFLGVGGLGFATKPSGMIEGDAGPGEEEDGGEAEEGGVEMEPANEAAEPFQGSAPSGGGGGSSVQGGAKGAIWFSRGVGRRWRRPRVPGCHRVGFGWVRSRGTVWIS